MLTIPEQFFETAKTFSKRTALKYKSGSGYLGISFEDFSLSVKSLALALMDLGIEKGDRLAILSLNSPEWYRMDLATLAIGAVSVPLHTTLSPSILSHIINDSKTKLIFVSGQEQFNKLLLTIDRVQSLKIVIHHNIDQLQEITGSIKLISLKELLSKKIEGVNNFSPCAKPEDLASIVYTSGTTALPKGVMLSHRNFMFDAESGVTVLPSDEKDTLLSFLPLSHVLERTAGYYAPFVCRGSCIAFAESTKMLPKNFHEIRPTIFIAVPRIFEKIHTSVWDRVKVTEKHHGFKYKLFVWALKQEPGSWSYPLADYLVFKKVRGLFGGRLRFAISGGATLNPKLSRFFDRLGIKITEGYGLTETAPVITVNRLNNLHFGTVGQHLPGIEIKLAADKEILTKGPNLMLGYYQNSELTSSVIDEEGWFHTGDLGFIDNEGFLTIIGRKKDMISLSNGKIAWPEQLEVILNNDRMIIQSFVYGDNRNYLIALIVPDWQEVTRELANIGISSQEAGQLVKNDQLIAFFTKRINRINEQLADWEKIRKFVLLPEEFTIEKEELTTTLKLRRQVIIDHYQKEISSLYL